LSKVSFLTLLSLFLTLIKGVTYVLCPNHQTIDIIAFQNRLGIGILALAMLLIGVVFVASASINNSQETLSKGGISEIIDSNNVQTPDFGPYIFDDLKKEPNFLLAKGQIPNYTNQVEKQNWIDKLDKCRVLLDNDKNMTSYIYPKGPVIGYAWNNHGYFMIMLYKNMNVTDSQIEEIYNVVNKTASKASIQEIPVVFSRDDLFQDEVSGYDSYYRPIIGAIKVTGQTGDWGTIGYAAKTSSGTKGYVTVQHLGTYVGYQMYQPTSNAAGSVSKISSQHADACFVPYSNVAAKIHVGGGVTRDVYGYDSSVPCNIWNNRLVYISGASSGLQSGHVGGVGTLPEGGGPYYNMVYADYSSLPGDSGAPVFYMPSGNRVLLGVHKGTFSGHKWFSPVSGVTSDLGVTPLTA
jgi:streptogrisin B